MAYGLNIVSVHYFLWFAALTPIYGFVSTYAEYYANVSSTQYGLLNMLLPLVTIVAKLFFCSLADRSQAYRSFFVYFLMSALVGYGSFGILPLFIEPQPKALGTNYLIWTLICLMTSTATISMGVISCLSDAFAMNSAKKNNSSYGIIRLWGTFGWGAISILIAFINQWQLLPLLVPGLIVTILLISADIVVVCLWPSNDDFLLDKSNSNIGIEEIATATSRDKSNMNDSTKLTDDNASPTFEISSYGTSGTSRDTERHKINDISDIKIQWLLFLEVARLRKSLYRYLVIFILSGTLISIHWSYFLLYLKKIYPSEFSFISGLSMLGQSILGELPFFIISKFVIEFLGRSHTLSVSLISIGVRYLMYAFLLPTSSMYFALLTEPFQGPSFGLFYVVMTEVGLDYSDCEIAIVNVIEKGIVENKPERLRQMRLALRATMQSLMSACYEGLGVGIGSIIGGLAIDYLDFRHLWISAGVLAIVIGSVNIIVELLNLSVFVDKRPILMLN